MCRLCEEVVCGMAISIELSLKRLKLLQCPSQRRKYTGLGEKLVSASPPGFGGDTIFVGEPSKAFNCLGIPPGGQANRN